MTNLKYRNCCVYEQGGVFYSCRQGQPDFVTDNPRLAVVNFAQNVEADLIDRLMTEAAAEGYDYYTGERVKEATA